MYIIIDNYDSFTYNLYQYFCEITDEEIVVYRNDTITVEEIVKLNPDGIIISPGPGRPEDAGISLAAIKHFAGKIPILGVCLGHQSIGHAFGAQIANAGRIVHGKAEEMTLDGKGLFRNLPKRATFTRYHSLAIVKNTLPAEFEITAVADDGEIMGVRHREHMIEGVQFHPESIASETGKKLLSNFLHYKRDAYPAQHMLSQVMSGNDLTQEEAAGFMEELTDGNLNNSQITAFLVALSIKGYTPQEIAGCASVLKRKKQAINSARPTLDTCGTGGDGLHTFNISSFSALIAASCGVDVAKHGNRAASSKSGSAEFYSQLGIAINMTYSQAEQLLADTNFTFLFAPVYHGSMRYAGPARKELGMKTIMNCLGPLANPAEAESQLIGVYTEELCEKMAEAARLLGVKRVMVVHGKDGMDEISVSSPTRIVEIHEDGKKKDYLFKPDEAGISGHTTEDLAGGTPADNAQLAKDLLAGKGRPAIKDAVCLNAGAALYIAGKAASIKAGYAMAKEALEKGKVGKKLDEVVHHSQKLVAAGATA
ncbi:MAG: bifunctional anthranilate synthase component II/anthranilate phosphoribosyltransferase [Spirochaetales bacterium]|nr:bifunctional anthranilate synthase component II/anthranilate phosphoribosyltransferase [Spirochaetales bacterium]